MNKKILIPLIMSSLFLCACGPQGETGPQGAQGQQGIPGEKGETGSSILTGTTNPSASIGKNGDTYVNVSTSTYFKKENGQWRVIFQDSSKNEQGLDFYLLDDGTYGVSVGKARYLSSIIIPDKYMGRNVSTILSYGFSPNSYDSQSGRYYSDTSRITAKSIYIPNSITKIENFAFCGLKSLTSINVPNSIISISDNAFNGCSFLTSIIIPNSVTFIGGYAFQDCSSSTIYCEAASKPSGWSSSWVNSDIPIVWNCIDHFTKDGINYGVTKNNELGVASLADKSLTSINIPSKIDGRRVTSIVENAFFRCLSLTSIVIPNSVASIGNGTFEYCVSLTSINIPNSVTSIGKYAFGACASLTSINIPNSVTSIGEYAFSRCSSLTIYCEAASKPSGWDFYWNYQNIPVIWGYTPK